ncbi:MAG: protein phosphatase 2C domain-containing protein [Bacteroidaceae bacterium]|nr:protein phosphatase 2C domain-containing protein [Bacteroidaceae bacterium]
MKIEIRQPLCFTEIGRKDQQEDSLFPRLGQATTANRYFLVCDGVGGSEHGEVASATVSQAIGEHLAQMQLPDGVLTEEIFAMALDQAYNALDYAESQQTASFKKMATTLTFLGLHRRGCLIAHIGDSRVYHVRPGIGILSRTSDHSLVNDLVKAGELTLEQAKTFKQKNIITRAMQPLMEVRDRAEFTHVLQVEAGDYFFLCCDGVLEHLQDEDLVNILSNPLWNDEDKLAAIKKICDEGNTRDNYTCYLIPIDNVVAEPLFDVVAAEDEIEGEVEPIVPIVPPSPSTTTNIPPCTPAIRPEPQPIVPTPPTKTNSNKFLWSIVVVLLLALAACVAFIMLGGEKESAQQAAPQVEEPVEDAPANLAPPKLDRPEKPQPQQEVITIPAQNPQKQKPRVTLPDGKGKNNPPKINLTPGTGNGNANGASQLDGTTPQNMDDLKSRQQGGTQSSSGPDKVPAQSGTPESSGGKSI